MAGDLDPDLADTGSIARVNLVARVPSATSRGVVARLQAANHQGVSELAAQQTDPRRPHGDASTRRSDTARHGFSGLDARFGRAVALTGLVVLVLLVTCANIANLLLARGAAHARDVSLRLSLGASTGRLVQQRLIEA